MEWGFLKPPDKPRFPSADDRFLDDLVRTKGDDDSVVHRHVWVILRNMRFRAAVAPWITLLKAPLKAAWSQTYGRYRKSRSKVHIGAALQSGRLPGAVPGTSPVPPGWHTIPTPVGATLFANTPSPIGPGQSFEDAGIRAGEVVAYRCWILRDGFLTSAYMNEFKWEPGVVAEGDPTESGEGIHAFKNRFDACQYVAQYESYDDGNTVVVSGTVELWGDVFEHSRGYRASRARIKSIDDSPNYDAVALRKQYKLNRKRKS